MKTIFLWRFMVLVYLSLSIMLGCTNTNESDVPTLYGNWAYVNVSDSVGAGLTLNENGEYVATFLTLTSDTSAWAIIEKGVFSASTSELSFTPQASSCADTTTETTSYKYNFGKDNSLNVLLPNGLISLQRNNSDGVSNFVITFGCTKDGKFYKAPLTDL